MSDVSDLELNRTEAAPPPPPEPRSAVPWIAVAIALVAAIALGWYFFGRATPPAEEPTTQFSEAAVPAAPERPGLQPTIELPPLDQTDPIIRKLVAELSSHPKVAAWLATNGLIRNFTVAVTNIAEGRVPAQQLRPLRPTGPFEIVETATTLRIDPRSYARYDSLADAISGIDAMGAAQLYVNVKPRVDEVYQELGLPVPFETTLERAIVMLLRAPVLDGDVPLNPKGGVFGYEDPKIEGLTAAQRQLIRMGPRNQRLIQDRLRAIARAIGIPSDRL